MDTETFHSIILRACSHNDLSLSQIQQITGENSVDVIKAIETLTAAGKLDFKLKKMYFTKTEVV